LIQDGVRCAALHGDKSQGARVRALEDFKSGAITALIATDIAARGLDIDQLPHVVNFDLPQVAEDYVHRIGRTGRAGADGQAISLVEPDEAYLLAAIEKVLKREIPQVADTGYEKVSLDVRNSKPSPKPKPQQPRAGQRQHAGNRAATHGKPGASERKPNQNRSRMR
jgi:ATP-dependent RNA helicase RhlE